MNEIFLEIVIAPDYTDDAMDILKKKKNIRLLKLGVQLRDGGQLEQGSAGHAATEEVVFNSQGANLASNHMVLTTVEGGLLIQERDKYQLADADLKVVSKRQPTEAEMKQLLFAWKVVKHVKSNAIVLVKDDMTIGVGAGQMNRVGAAKIAIEQAGDKAQGSFMSSDAFFPMGDTVKLAAEAGITAIIQPGGSIKDEESIVAADEYDLVMVMTGVRHFKH